MTITQDISEETDILRPSLLISSHDSYLRVRPRQGNKFDAHLSSLWYSCDRFRRVRSTKCGCTFAREVLDLYIKYRGHCTVPLRDTCFLQATSSKRHQYAMRAASVCAAALGPRCHRVRSLAGLRCKSMGQFVGQCHHT